MVGKAKDAGCDKKRCVCCDSIGLRSIISQENHGYFGHGTLDFHGVADKRELYQLAVGATMSKGAKRDRGKGTALLDTGKTCLLFTESFRDTVPRFRLLYSTESLFNSSRS